MKKVIFISAIALAAAVSCTKSEVVDTKFNEQIGFETYLGRDAQTKAPVATSITEAGIYGYYTAAQKYDSKTSTANLWVNGTLSGAGSVDPVKYWTNDSDWYSFAAYAPKGNTNLTVPTTEFNGDPVITYNVPNALGSQIDLLYASAIDQKKPASGASVALPFKHALSRLTVKAQAAAGDFTFTITDITVSGGFYTAGELNLVSGEWTKTTAAVAEGEGKNDTYTIFNGSSVLSPTQVDYAVTDKGSDNYLMFIPTSNEVKVNVTYTITYANQVSNPNVKSFVVTPEGGFAQGFAYGVNLNFMLDTDNAITFNVSVSPWDETTSDQNLYPEGEPETPVDPAE